MEHDQIKVKKLNEIYDESYDECVEGKIVAIEIKKIGGKKWNIISLADEDEGLTCFISHEDIVSTNIKAGQAVQVQGSVRFNMDIKDVVLWIKQIETIPDNPNWTKQHDKIADKILTHGNIGLSKNINQEMNPEKIFSAIQEYYHDLGVPRRDAYYLMLIDSIMRKSINKFSKRQKGWSTVKRFYLPTKSAEDWKSFLASESHWKKGHSAATLAYCWEEAEGFPLEIQKVFLDSKQSQFVTAQILFAFPEYKVPLPGGVNASQNDIYVLAKSADGLFPIMVEGKVDESFGSLVKTWKEDGGFTPGKQERLQFLLSTLGLQSNVQVDHIRYQLLHRAASAIIEAKRIGSTNAVVLIHSFSKEDRWFEDYNSFLNLFGLRAEKDTVSSPHRIETVTVYFVWVRGNKEYLTKGS